jgi:hypothetical protein
MKAQLPLPRGKRRAWPYLRRESLDRSSGAPKSPDMVPVVCSMPSSNIARRLAEETVRAFADAFYCGWSSGKCLADTSEVCLTSRPALNAFVARRRRSLVRSLAYVRGRIATNSA